MYTEISSKKRDLLSLRSDQTRAYFITLAQCSRLAMSCSINHTYYNIYLDLGNKIKIYFLAYQITKVVRFVI